MARAEVFVRRASWSLALASLALVTLASRPASAEGPRSGVRLDTLQPAPPESPFTRAEGPFDLPRDEVSYAASFGLDFAKSPLRVLGVDATGAATEVTRLVDASLMGRLALSISPVKWVRIDAMVPFALFQQGALAADATTGFGGSQVRGVAAQGLGDPRLGLGLRLYDGESIDFVLSGHFWAPVGSDAAYLSDKRFRGEAELSLAGRTGAPREGGFLWGATLAVAPGIFASRDGDRVAFSAALHRRFGSLFSLGLEPAFALTLDVRPDGTSAPQWVVEPLLAARVTPGPVQISLAAGPSFGTAPGASEVRALLSFSYLGRARASAGPAKGSSDPDFDGVQGDQDACPDEAGPASSDPQKNGCPTLDRDGDSVLDARDACPDKSGAPSTDPKANGCPDSDNDGLADPLDPCPKQPGIAGASEPGCPQYARLVGKVFEVKPPVAFSGNQAKLSREGLAAVLEVAATVRANASFELVSVVLGTKGAAGAIADRRAQELISALKAGGLDPSRFQVELSAERPAGSVTFTIP